MRPEEYANYDALGLADLVRSGDINTKEIAIACAETIDSANHIINAVVEVYEDRIENPDIEINENGIFRGVPFLIKDAGGHEKGRKIENGSRLCKGMVAKFDTNFALMLRNSGVNIIGRSNAPEFSIATSTENLLYGNTSTPWRTCYSSGGSSGGAAASVAAGIVPMAHGTDIAVQYEYPLPGVE